MARSARLVIIANRLPVHRSGASSAWQISPGGLVSALAPVMRERSGVWTGWAGAAGRAPRSFEHDGLSMRPVAMTASEVEHCYHGMSNRTLWPLYHDAIRTPEFHRTWWRSYEAVNARFARAAARRSRASDILWVHDYHLQLVPRMLREAQTKRTIGFFLHIPFPPDELFAWLPWRSAILRGLLGADVVGFQTFDSVRNFSRAARRYASVEGTDTELRVEGRTVQVSSFPISVDFAEFERLAGSPAVRAKAREIRERLGSKRKVILCVDRLDYTKGIETRLAAYEELLRRGELSVREAVMVQIAVPTREPVPDYIDTRSDVERTVGRINGMVSEPGRVAVHYFRRNLSREDLVAYYVAADVMLVTPLRDGMNLVAKEYVATRLDNSGVLVLSEFAGAARELRRAILVNPRDIDGLGAAIIQGLRIRREDARRRMAILRMQVRRHDVHDWAAQFLERLER